MEDDIEILDVSTDAEKRFQLTVRGSPVALLTRSKYGHVNITWQVYGPQVWPEALSLVKGLLHLTAVADQLTGEHRVKSQEA